tara:strand:- start:11145 stop:11375 length:231 start_codon:yes stop_codon:yes gene_type:complete
MELTTNKGNQMTEQQIRADQMEVGGIYEIKGIMLNIVKVGYHWADKNKNFIHADGYDIDDTFHRVMIANHRLVTEL